MKGKGALALLLFTGAGLIYAATVRRHDGAPARQAAARPDQAAKTAKTAMTAMTAGAGRHADADALTARLDRVLARMRAEVPAGQDTGRFVCKLPAQVGPVPLHDAVDAYLRALPASRADPVLLAGLHRAAQAGNWLAKAQVYQLRSAQPAPDDATAEQTLALMEWLQERRIGALYAAVGDLLAASDDRGDRAGGRLSRLDIYAAMHHDYPSQYKVGRELARSGDARQAAAGRRMLACAARAWPAPARRRPAMDGAALAARP